MLHVDSILDKLDGPSGVDTADLTEREQQVLSFIADGYSMKEIAYKLSISSKTVETHRRKIMEKLRIYNIPQLTKYAIKAGLTSL